MPNGVLLAPRAAVRPMAEINSLPRREHFEPRWLRAFGFGLRPGLNIGVKKFPGNPKLPGSFPFFRNLNMCNVRGPGFDLLLPNPKEPPKICI